MKVLVIENAIERENPLAAGLHKLGYAVDVVDNGLRAINQVSSRHYDIIILDLMLPKESSLRVLHEIRESDRDVEILILSARDQIHDRVTALIQGADDYLIKPFSFDELHARIQGLVRRKTRQKTIPARSEDRRASHRYLDSLIGNLLELCDNDGEKIELVISEVKLANLLERVGSSLAPQASYKNVRLQLPEGKLPTLLVDAKWTEHLLSNLLFNAISNSPANADIKIRVRRGRERCCIDIESKADEAFDLSLIKSYASYLNLEVTRSFSECSLHRVRVLNIKIL